MTEFSELNPENVRLLQRADGHVDVVVYGVERSPQKLYPRILDMDDIRIRAALATRRVVAVEYKRVQPETKMDDGLTPAQRKRVLDDMRFYADRGCTFDIKIA